MDGHHIEAVIEAEQAADEGRQGARARRKDEAVAEQHPEQAHHGQGGKAHHHGVEHVAAAHEAPVEERERWCHQQHQGGADQHEAVVGTPQGFGGEIRGGGGKGSEVQRLGFAGAVVRQQSEAQQQLQHPVRVALAPGLP